MSRLGQPTFFLKKFLLFDCNTQMGRNLSYDAGREQAKILLSALVSFVEDLGESKDCKADWQAGTELWVTHSTLEGLAELTNRYGENLDTEEIRNALLCLNALKIIDDKREQISATTRTNSKVWRFALSFPSIDTEENLNWLFESDGEWDKRRQAQKSKPAKVPKHTAAKSQGVDWSKICRTMLEKHKRLTTNELLFADEDMKFELDDIHVPLALMQRTKPDRRSGDVSPEQGSQLLQPSGYEEKQRFKHEDFLAQVLEKGVGKTKGKRIALIGEPGAGKTTLLQAIAFRILKKNLGLPIWISLADLQQQDGNLEDFKKYLLQKWLETAIPETRLTQGITTDFTNQYESGRVWLLLDGVDEIATGHTAPLQAIASQLQGWVAKARVVLTCRLNVWEANLNALEDFETYRLLDFDYPEQVKEFIEKWFQPRNLTPLPPLRNAQRGSQKGERLWVELDQPERQRIQDLVKNPLRLALLCSTYDPPLPPEDRGVSESPPPFQGGVRGGSSGLPDTKAGLYQQFVETFYIWKENRFPTTEQQQEELNAALGRLAKRAIDSEAFRFRLRHKFVREELGDPKQRGSLFWWALQLGWLNEIGLAAESVTKEKVYAFYHPTFQEYFAALAIADWHFFLNHVPDNPVQGTYRIFEPQWKEVILLWLGREDVAKEEKEEFVKALVEFEDGCGKFYWYRTYFFVGAGIAEYKNYPKADEIVAQIVKWGFGYFDSEKQQWLSYFKEIADTAKIALKQTDIQRKTAALVQLIQQSEREYLCWEVANHLAQNGANYPEVLSALLDSIREYPNEFSVAKEKILRKIYFRNQEAIAALVELMNNSQDEYTRIISALCIGTIDPGNPQAVGVLVDLINDYKDKEICKMAISFLGEIGNTNQRAFHTLFDLSKSSQDKEIRETALFSLGEIGTINPKAVAALVDLSNHSPDEDIRSLVQVILSQNNIEQKFSSPIIYGITRISDYLIKLKRKSQDEEEYKFAKSILRKFNSYNQIEAVALVELIKKSQDINIQRPAITILGEIGLGNQKAIDALVELINNSQDENIRHSAVESLGKIDSGNPIVIDTLVELINNRQKIFLFSSVLTNLGKFGSGNPKAVDALVELVRNSKNESTHSEATESLQKILTEDQMPTVVIALKDTLSEETYENDFERYKHCVEVLWHCAQNMTYLAFYQAWHQQEGEGNTNTPITQTLNPADLPQRLQSAIAKRCCFQQIANNPQLSQTIHLICIDTSKFIDPDNPAAKIYTEIVKGGCPKCEDGTPKTMAELQTYWDLLESDKRVVLVFYEGKGSTSQGLSQAFLNNISKFDGAICVISDEPKDDIPVKFFTSSQAIQDLVQWLRDI